MEKTNARSLNATSFSEPIDIVVMDLSFTSVTGILPVIDTITQKQTPWIVLIKPQFELPLSKIGKGGVVTQEHDRQEAIDRVVNSAENLGRICKGLIESPIKGTKGNIEFLAYFG
jgi:23S rRNA (cytidine1920-2'-O)/16S rRNA (cytidine1409-2'-O)-methyltransferase